jgi:hypothetical protein
LQVGISQNRKNILPLPTATFPIPQVFLQKRKFSRKFFMVSIILSNFKRALHFHLFSQTVLHHWEIKFSENFRQYLKQKIYFYASRFVEQGYFDVYARCKNILPSLIPITSKSRFTTFAYKIILVFCPLTDISKHPRV